MLKVIAENSAELLNFMEAMDMPLSAPQKQHVLNIADALITTEGRKDLSNLYRHIVDDPCPKSAADTFREAPWGANAISDIRVTLDMRPYLRADTVRHLNKERAEDEQLTFQTKLVIAKEMLEAIQPMLPKDQRVYVFFDSWYASAVLIKWYRSQDWHVICRIKSNRNLSGDRVKGHHQRLKHQRYTRIRVPSADPTDPRRYLVRSVIVKLNGLADDVRLFLSKKHSRDRWVRYYLGTAPPWAHKRR